MIPEHTKLAENLRQLAANASLEATPAAMASAPSLGQILGRGRTVYVPFPPRAEIGDTVAACRRLAGEGLFPVPHLAARAVQSRQQLNDWLSQLVEAGAQRVFLIAGDAKKPRGPFRDTLAVLETGLLAQHGIRHVGVAGYPEGHPVVATTALWQALAQKAAYARETDTKMWLVSQFAFETAPIAAWLRAVDEADLGLPVWIGIAGPAQLRTLLDFALRCGVGASATAIMRRPSAVFQLAARWVPSALLADLAHLHVATQVKPFEGIHVFAFSGVRQSAAWLDDVYADPAGFAGSGSLPEDSAVRRVS